MDAYVHVTLNPYDYGAAMIIVEEAGGRVARMDGGPIHFFDGRVGVLGSNGLIHEELTSVIGRGR